MRRLKNQLIKLNTNVKKNKKYNNIYNKYCICILSIENFFKKFSSTYKVDVGYMYMYLITHIYYILYLF